MSTRIPAKDEVWRSTVGEEFTVLLVHDGHAACVVTGRGDTYHCWVSVHWLQSNARPADQ